LLDEGAGACRAHLFFHLLGATQLETSFATRRFDSATGTDFFGHELVQVSRELRVEIALDVFASEQVADEARQPRRQTQKLAPIDVL